MIVITDHLNLYKHIVLFSNVSNSNRNKNSTPSAQSWLHFQDVNARARHARSGLSHPKRVAGAAWAYRIGGTELGDWDNDADQFSVKP